MRRFPATAPTLPVERARSIDTAAKALGVPRDHLERFIRCCANPHAAAIGAAFDWPTEPIFDLDVIRGRLFRSELEPLWLFSKLAAINRANLPDRKLLELATPLMSRIWDVVDQSDRPDRVRQRLLEVRPALSAAVATGNVLTVLERWDCVRAIVGRQVLEECASHIEIYPDFGRANAPVIDGAACLAVVDHLLSQPARRGRPPAPAREIERLVREAYLAVTCERRRRWTKTARRDGALGGEYVDLLRAVLDRCGLPPPTDRILSPL